MTFEAPDYYQVDELYTEEELLVRSSVRKFVEDRALPVLPACFTENRFPAELVGDLAGLGLKKLELRRLKRAISKVT